MNIMNWCSCESGKYRWRDVASINGTYVKVDEEVFMTDDEFFDIEPIFDKLAKQYNVSVDNVILASFEKGAFDESIINKMLNGQSLGGYCAVCGG